MEEIREKFLRKLYSEIISGFSIYSLGGDTIYIKHLSPVDTLEIDYFYSYYYDKLIKKGIFSRRERLNQIISDELWSQDKEKEIEYIQEVIKDLHNNKRKVFTRADFDSFDSQIKEQESKLFVLLGEKYILLGQCAEDKAQERISYILLQKSFFHDINLSHNIIDKNMMFDLEDDIIGEYFSIYNKFTSDFHLNNLKSVALCAFFQNSYHLANSPFEFYGIPVVKMSDYQTTLINYGTYYKTILQSNPPTKYSDDPTKLEDWFNGKRNIDELIEKQENSGGNLSLPGASQSDVEDYGYKMDNSVNEKIAKEVDKETGELSLNQMMRLGLI